MILVCPACDAKFKIPDGAIPPGGRKVRCASCKHSWHAQPQQILKKPAPTMAPQPSNKAPAPESPAQEMDAGAAAKAAAIRRSVRAIEEPPAPLPEEDDMFDEGSEAPTNDFGIEEDFEEDNEPAIERDEIDDDEDDFGIAAVAREHLGDDFSLDGDDDEDSEDYDEGDFVARRRAEQRREAERKAVSGRRKLMLFGWMSLVLFWLVVLFSLVFMRDTVVKVMPGMTSFYSMFDGVRDVDRFRPEDGESLSQPMTEREAYVAAKLYGDRTGVETVEGRQVLVVRGFVENTGTTPGAMTATVPQVQIDILDRQGRVLETVIADPEGFAIRRGGKADFETSVYPIPAGAANVEAKVMQGTRSRVVRSTGG